MLRTAHIFAHFLLLSFAMLVPLAGGQHEGLNDPTFNSARENDRFGYGADATVRAIAVQADGKILIGGMFTHFNGVPRRGLARLNVNGSVDSDFNQGVGLAPFATIPICALADLLIEPSGKITLVGVFGSYNGMARRNILRLNADGSLDASLNPGSGPDDVVSTIDRLSDGRYVI